MHLAVEVPSASIDFSKVKGKYHADVNVLGIAYRADGTVASRFSDEVTLDMEKADWEKFTQSPMKYENQFSVAPGTLPSERGRQRRRRQIRQVRDSPEY